MIIILTQTAPSITYGWGFLRPRTERDNSPPHTERGIRPGRLEARSHFGHGLCRRIYIYIYIWDVRRWFLFFVYILAHATRWLITTAHNGYHWLKAPFTKTGVVGESRNLFQNSQIVQQPMWKQTVTRCHQVDRLVKIIGLQIVFNKNLQDH